MEKAKDELEKSHTEKKKEDSVEEQPTDCNKDTPTDCDKDTPTDCNKDTPTTIDNPSTLDTPTSSDHQILDVPTEANESLTEDTPPNDTILSSTVTTGSEAEVLINGAESDNTMDVLVIDGVEIKGEKLDVPELTESTTDNGMCTRVGSCDGHVISFFI